MSALPDPIWPVVVLALIQLGDALLCIKPVAFIADCFERVHWPHRLWWVMPPIKLAAAAGLVAGVWVDYLGTATCLALVAYFIIAMAMHVRAHDVGRNLFLNAAGMLVVCTATGVYSFVL